MPFRIFNPLKYKNMTDKIAIMTAICQPDEVAQKMADMLKVFESEHPGRVLRNIQHSTCAYGMGFNARILVSMIVEHEDNPVLKVVEQ